MEIANPIYDGVFKYLMEDNEIAKLIISNIIEQEIIELDFLPQERSTKIEHNRRFFTVFRMDFSATIKVKDQSYRNIIIEIQKAKLPTDIMRFRRYLGDRYKDKANVYTIKDDKGEARKKAIPIFSIYFLGYELERIKDDPVIDVHRSYYSRRSGRKIEEREDFIESLTHDSVVIQIPFLKKRYVTELEKLLSVFDQSCITSDEHILNIKEEEYPEKYGRVIRRLQRAILSKQIRDDMDAEDDVIEELKELERDVAKKDKALEEKDKVIEEKDRIIEELKKRLSKGE